MSEHTTDRIEQAILDGLANLHHGRDNIPERDRRGATALAEVIADGRSPWAIRDRGGVLELPLGGYVQVGSLLPRDVSGQIERALEADR